jgi:hypothetical protein
MVHNMPELLGQYQMTAVCLFRRRPFFASTPALRGKEY